MAFTDVTFLGNFLVSLALSDVPGLPPRLELDFQFLFHLAQCFPNPRSLYDHHCLGAPQEGAITSRGLGTEDL